MSKKKESTSPPVNYERFWVIVRERKEKTYLKHLSLDSANQEAQRLANKDGDAVRPFYVCEVVAAKFKVQ